MENETTASEASGQDLGAYHEEGMVNNRSEKAKASPSILGCEKLEALLEQKRAEEGMQWENATQQERESRFNFILAPTTFEGITTKGLDLDKTELGPMTMTYELGVGWVAEKLGPRSGHWKRLARNTKPKTNDTDLGPINQKGEGPTPLSDLDPHIIDLKRRKNQKQKSNKA